MEKATQQGTKEQNRNLVLKTIFEHESISRAEIARITSLTRTTVSDIVADLLEEGLVSEIGVGPSRGGKSPILLSLVEDSRYLIGVDLANSQFHGAVVNLRGKIRARVSLPVNNPSGEEALGLVYDVLDQLMQAAYQPIVGIGVCTPGLVNTSKGLVLNAVNLDWEDLPLAHLLQDRYQLPVYVLNDSQATVMGEYTYGENHSSGSNLVVINARQGIGAGIVINGQLFQGDGGGAGEIGHIIAVLEDGQLCRCNKRGCLETVASSQALVRQARLLAGQPGSLLPHAPQEINLDSIDQAFHHDDPQVRRLVLETARYMGLAIASLVGTLNIQEIVLVGDMTRFGPSWLDVIQETVSQNSLSRLARDTRVEISKLNGNATILGASAMLANNYALLFNRQTLRTGAQ
jgi:predicted NBD/HSP70 family sugar kinase